MNISSLVVVGAPSNTFTMRKEIFFAVLLLACLPAIYSLSQRDATRRGHPSLPFLMVKKKLNKNGQHAMPPVTHKTKAVAAPKPKLPLLSRREKDIELPPKANAGPKPEKTLLSHREKDIELPSKVRQIKAVDSNMIMNPKKLITEHHKTPKTIHMPLSARKKVFGQLISWTERSDVVGDYDHLAVQHPNITVDEAIDVDTECVDAPDEYYEQEEEENDEKQSILEKVVDRTVNKYSKYDFSTGKLFDSKSNKRICNITEHELLRKEHHRKKISLSSELISQ